MSLMVKPLLMGALAVTVVGFGVNAVDANGGIGGIAFMLGTAISGLIGGAVSRRLPPRRRL